MPARWSKAGEPQLDPGRRRERITFLQPVTVEDASGTSTAWQPSSPADVTSAEIVQVRGVDVIKAGQDVTQVYCTATIRYAPPGRRANARFQDSRGNVYVIQAVKDMEPGRLVYQELVCLLIGVQG